MADDSTTLRPISFARYLQKRMLLLLVAPIVSVALIWTIVELTLFSTSIDGLRESYLEDQKSNLHSELNGISQLISNIRYENDKELYDLVKNRTEQAWTLLDSLYNKYHSTKTEAQLLELAREALRPLRYDGGDSYFFLIGLDGVDYLSSARPELEGRNIMNIQDSAGRWVIQDMVELGKSAGQGYYAYTWAHPTRVGDDFAKLSYLKLYKPLRVIIGMGAYQIDAEERQQSLVLDLLKKLSFGNDGYVFVYRQSDGVLLYDRAAPDMVERNVRSYKDKTGKAILIEMEKLVDSASGEGFVDYEWNRISTGNMAKKLSLVKKIQGWNWIIGRGIYFDEIDAGIELFRYRVTDAFGLRVLLLLILLLCVVALGFIFLHRVSLRLQGDIQFFGNFFSRAFKDNMKVPLEGIHLEEFRTMAMVVNDALEVQGLTIRDLASKEQRYRSLFEGSNDAVFIHKIDGLILEHNRHARLIFPFMEHSTMPYTLAALFETNQSNRIAEFLTVLFNDGSVRMELSTQGLNQQILFLDVSAVMINREEGIAQTLMRDISTNVLARQNIEQLNLELAKKVDRQSLALKQSALELEQARNEVIRAEKMANLGQLVSVLGHEMGTPLGIGITLSSMLDDQVRALERSAGAGTLTKSDLDTFMETVASSAQLINHNLIRASDLIGNVKTIAVDQAVGMPRPYNPLEYMGKIIQSMEPQTRRNHHILNLRGQNNIEIYGDPGLLYQVVTNLVNNSFLHAFAGMASGQIDIELRVEENRLVMDYHDNGCGIPAELKEKVFEQYFTTKRGQGGSGLGLHVVKSLILDAGGSITLESSPGKGVRFLMYLPLTQSS